ncbi:MAG TPA: DUF3147 family protein [Gallionellaceae bacterium]
MLNYAIKIIVSALVLVAASELAKRNTFLAALLIALPLTSLLAFVWLYLDTGDVQKVAALSLNIFWLVLPSLALFLLLPVLLKFGWGFWLSLALSMAATAGCYGIMVAIFKQFGVQP